MNRSVSADSGGERASIVSKNARNSSGGRWRRLSMSFTGGGSSHGHSKDHFARIQSLVQQTLANNFRARQQPSTATNREEMTPPSKAVSAGKRSIRNEIQQAK